MRTMTVEMKITVENDEQKDASVACLVRGEEEGDLPFGFTVQVIGKAWNMGVIE